MEYQYCVFIGRFQPPHKAHIQVVRQALKEAERVIIIIGSARGARTIKNPWSYDERCAMMRACFNPADNERISFAPARDYYYSDNLWVTQVQQAVNMVSNGSSSVAMIGSYKDSSSYYIKYFPQWDFIPAKTDKSMNATDARTDLFEYGTLNDDLPAEVAQWIINDGQMNASRYEELKKEYAQITEYKKSWSAAPFPVTFNTVDAVVVQSGHVLVVRRKFSPGKGLLALPGGFIKQNETLKAACIRELKEETGIRLPSVVLQSNIVDSKVFDHPGRSLRGRTITHAFCVRLADGDLPEVKASDDASDAFWLPLMDCSRLEESFFEDHCHIIQAFTSKF